MPAQVTKATHKAMPLGLAKRTDPWYNPTDHVHLGALARDENGRMVHGEVSYIMSWFPKCCAYTLVKNMYTKVGTFNEAYGGTSARYVIGGRQEIERTSLDAAAMLARYEEDDPTLPYLNINKALGVDAFPRRDMALFMYGWAACDIIMRTLDKFDRVGVVAASNKKSDLHCVMATMAELFKAECSVSMSPWMVNKRSQHPCSVFTADVTGADLLDGLCPEAVRVRHVWSTMHVEIPDRLFVQGQYYAQTDIFPNGEEDMII